MPQIGPEDEDQEVELMEVDAGVPKGATEVKVQIDLTEDHVMSETQSHVSNKLSKGKSTTPEPKNYSRSDGQSLPLPLSNGIEISKTQPLTLAQKERDEQIAEFARVVSKTPADVAQRVLRETTGVFSSLRITTSGMFNTF
jgi:hypothetical protein